MSQKEAERRIKSFLKNHKGKSVLFAGLSEQEKFDYVLVKTFSYFSKPNRFPAEALKRAIGNAEAHQRDGYSVYAGNLNEHLVIS